MNRQGPPPEERGKKPNSSAISVEDAMRVLQSAAQDGRLGEGYRQKLLELTAPLSGNSSPFLAASLPSVPTDAPKQGIEAGPAFCWNNINLSLVDRKGLMADVTRCLTEHGFLIAHLIADTFGTQVALAIEAKGPRKSLATVLDALKKDGLPPQPPRFSSEERVLNNDPMAHLQTGVTWRLEIHARWQPQLHLLTDLTAFLADKVELEFLRVVSTECYGDFPGEVALERWLHIEAYLRNMKSDVAEIIDKELNERCIPWQIGGHLLRVHAHLLPTDD